MSKTFKLAWQGIFKLQITLPPGVSFGPVQLPSLEILLNYLLNQDTIKDHSCVQQLPKLVLIVLEQLLGEKDIPVLSYSVQVNGEVAYLNLKFGLVGHVDPATPSPGLGEEPL